MRKIETRDPDYILFKLRIKPPSNNKGVSLVYIMNLNMSRAIDLLRYQVNSLISIQISILVSIDQLSSDR